MVETPTNKDWKKYNATGAIVMPKEDRLGLLDTMANLKLPTRLASGFKKHIVKSKLGGMKSHDYHVLLQ
jgi:hypothetical protein